MIKMPTRRLWLAPPAHNHGPFSIGRRGAVNGRGLLDKECAPNLSTQPSGILGIPRFVLYRQLNSSGRADVNAVSAPAPTNFSGRQAT